MYFLKKVATKTKQTCSKTNFVIRWFLTVDTGIVMHLALCLSHSREDQLTLSAVDIGYHLRYIYGKWRLIELALSVKWFGIDCHIHFHSVGCAFITKQCYRSTTHLQAELIFFASALKGILHSIVLHSQCRIASMMTSQNGGMAWCIKRCIKYDLIHLRCFISAWSTLTETGNKQLLIEAVSNCRFCLDWFVKLDIALEPFVV